MIYKKMIENQEIDDDTPHEEGPKLSCEDYDNDKKEDGQEAAELHEGGNDSEAKRARAKIIEAELKAKQHKLKFKKYLD